MAYRELTLKEALWLIHRIRFLCSNQNLKIDATAKRVLSMIEKELKNV